MEVFKHQWQHWSIKCSTWVSHMNRTLHSDIEYKPYFLSSARFLTLIKYRTLVKLEWKVLSRFHLQRSKYKITTAYLVIHNNLLPILLVLLNLSKTKKRHANRHPKSWFATFSKHPQLKTQINFSSFVTLIRSPSGEYLSRISLIYWALASRGEDKIAGGKYRSRQLKRRGLNSNGRSS